MTDKWMGGERMDTVPSKRFFFPIANSASIISFLSAAIFRLMASFFDKRLWLYAPYKTPAPNNDQRPNWNSKKREKKRKKFFVWKWLRSTRNWEAIVGLNRHLFVVAKAFEFVWPWISLYLLWFHIETTSNLQICPKHQFHFGLWKPITFQIHRMVIEFSVFFPIAYIIT